MLVVFRRNQHMADHWHCRQGNLAEDLRTRRHIAPGEHFTTLLGERTLEFRVRFGYIRRKEDNPDRQGHFRCKRQAGRAQQEIARNSGTDADTVTRLAIGGNGAAVRQAGKRGKRLHENVMRRLSTQGRNKSYATRVVFKARIYKRGLGWGWRDTLTPR